MEDYESVELNGFGFGGQSFSKYEYDGSTKRLEFDFLGGLGNTGFDQDQEVTPRTPFTSKILWPILPKPRM